MIELNLAQLETVNGENELFWDAMTNAEDTWRELYPNEDIWERDIRFQDLVRSNLDSVGINY